MTARTHATDEPVVVLEGEILPIIGAGCICLGLVLMVATIRLFVTVGNGTLAPWKPTQKLVVQGVYRQVRNPMISGGFSILLTAKAVKLTISEHYDSMIQVERQAGGQAMTAGC